MALGLFLSDEGKCNWAKNCEPGPSLSYKEY